MIWTPSLSLKVMPENLVEGHDVPDADQADLAASHIIEQVRDGGLSAGNEDAVRADFLVDVALARSTRPQFGEVVVVLGQRNHARQKVPFDALLKVCWLHAGRTQQDVDPLLFGERAASLEQLVHIHVRHLDRLQVAQQERRALLRLLVEIFEGGDAPDAADQQLLELLDDIAGDLDPADAEVAELRLVDVALLVERHAHLVDDLETAALADRRFHLLRLVGTHVVLGEDLFDRAEAVFDNGLVVRRAVGSEQIFQDVDWHVGAFLDQLGQVLANDLAREVPVQQVVEAFVGSEGLRSHR